LRVLELGHIVAGPTAGQILADLGAEVLKIETVNGVPRAPGREARRSTFHNRTRAVLRSI
jgi:crotonobetainyl-CoA:carnitine CoA-transferase CaiB-like acyl-CoA transferase